MKLAPHANQFGAFLKEYLSVQGVFVKMYIHVCVCVCEHV